VSGTRKLLSVPKQKILISISWTWAERSSLAYEVSSPVLKYSKQYNHTLMGVEVQHRTKRKCFTSSYARSEKCEKWLLTSLRLSVHLSRPYMWKNSASTGRVFMKFDIWVFFENLSRIIKFHLSLTRITVALREDGCTFTIISRSFLLRIRNVLGHNCREDQNTHFTFSNFFPKIGPFVR
jgi:hypothetical protein